MLPSIQNRKDSQKLTDNINNKVRNKEVIRKASPDTINMLLSNLNKNIQAEKDQSVKKTRDNSLGIKKEKTGLFY